MATFLNRARYAAYRGISKQYVGRLVATGKLTLVGGLLDVEECDRILGQKNPSYSEAEANGKMWGGDPKKSKERPLIYEETEEDDASPPLSAQNPVKQLKPTLNDVRIKQGMANLKLNLQTFEKRKGELLSRDAIVEVNANVLTIISTHLDGLGRRIAHDLSVMTHEGEIQALILREVRQIRLAAHNELLAFLGN